MFRSVDRKGSTTTLVAVALVAAACLLGALGVFVFRGAEDDETTLILHTVGRGPFVHEVVERGEVESSRNVEIRCEVKGRNSDGTAILEVVEEGTRVEAGDLLIRLDSSALEQDLIQQRITCNTVHSLMIQAKNEFEAATMARKEYLEGTFHQEEQTLKSEVFLAEENLSRAQEYLKFSERLAAKGYVTDLQLESDRFAVQKAQNELDAAKTKLRVLQDYTKLKMLKDLDSQIATAKAKWESEESSYNLERSKQREIEDQIAKCEIRAPQAGQVVYANQQSRRSEGEFVVEPGAVVRERQAIIRLPDPASMQVKAKINESRITLIKPGMLVRVRLDAFDDVQLKGEVIRVNEYPEAGSWFSSQIKQYATYINIVDPPSQIRPGLTAEVRILVERQADVVSVPVQAVHEHGDKFYCMVREGDSWTARQVQLASSNDKMVIVQSGLAPGEQVTMNPRSLLDVVDLPELPANQRLKSGEMLAGDLDSMGSLHGGDDVAQRTQDRAVSQPEAGADGQDAALVDTSVETSAVSTAGDSKSGGVVAASGGE